MKTHREQEFVVAGYTKGKGRRAGTLRLARPGRPRDGELEYVGNVGTGFDEDEIERLLGQAATARARTSAVRARCPKMPKVRRDDVVWVEPELVAEV